MRLTIAVALLLFCMFYGMGTECKIQWGLLPSKRFAGDIWEPPRILDHTRARTLPWYRKLHFSPL